jgi:hypothetical protein
MILRITAATFTASGPFTVHSARLSHTAAANAQIRDTALSEVADLRIVADPLTDTVYFNPPLELNGLDIAKTDTAKLFLNLG